MMLKRTGSMSGVSAAWMAGWCVGLCLGVGATCLGAQSDPPAKPAPQDNPFPAEPQKAAPRTGDDKAGPVQKPSAQKPGAATSGAQDSTKQSPPKPAGGNEFPGEGSDAPIIPVDPGPNAGSREPGGKDAAERSSSGDRGDDPVRSPDGAGSSGGAGSDDGFSSSNAGLSPRSSDDDAPATGKPAKSKAKEIKEDVDVGGFYLDKKNWKAAQERFQTAFALDAENPDAVWGLAEAERHLQQLDRAKAHYELFLSYDPTGPHSKAARKALEQVESERASTAGSTKAKSDTPQ